MTFFDYRIVAPKRGDPPFRAYAYIVPKKPCAIDENGWPLLTPQITEPEIDGNIQALKDDLDKVGKRAKRAVERANKRTKERLSEQSE